MPIDPNFTFDVFLSYAREDVSWARRLETELSGRGLEVFRDEARLTPGGFWDEQLMTALRSSMQLVVLRSEAAKASDWVGRETERFIVERQQPGAPPAAGGPIIVMLEGRWTSLDRYQVVGEIKALGAYPAGAEALPDSVWLAVTNAVEKGIRVRDTRRPIPVVVLTTTRARLEQVDGDKQQGEGLSLNELAQQLGLGTGEDVLARYGPRRSDWCPFGEQRIDVLLQDLEDEINTRARAHHAPQVRWEYPDEAALWDVKADVARRSVLRLERDPCLIVLDPIALFDEPVKRLFDNVLSKPLQNSDALLLVLAPVSTGPALLLRKQLEEFAYRAFESFYEPSLGASYAQVALHVADRLDLQGWLLKSLKPMLAADMPGRAPPFTGMLPQ